MTYELLASFDTADECSRDLAPMYFPDDRKKPMMNCVLVGVNEDV